MKYEGYNFKDMSSGGDLTRTFIRRHTRVSTAIVVTQRILTEHPEHYYQYELVRKFFNKFLIEKTEIHTERTWLNITYIINQHFIQHDTRRT